MPLRKYPERLFAIFVFSVFLITSCRKEEDQVENKYFVSKEMITSYNESYITSLIEAASAIFNVNVDLRPLVSTGVELYKVVYETTVEGNKIKASGLVCAPTEQGDYPVLSFQNGTNTRNSNAPSNFPQDYGFQMVEVIASMGYVVVISDYPGFGESKQIPHPYLVAEPTVRSIVDMLYAVREMDAELPNINVKNEYYLIGYSQGGWATLQMHKALELTYKDDFNLQGTSAGAGPYNIYLLMQKILSQETFPEPYYIGYVINGYKSYNQFTNPVSDLLNEPYASRVGGLFNGTLNAGQINAQLTTNIRNLVNADFLAGFATSPKYASVRQAMIDNSIAPWHTNIPLLLIHGDADTHVDPSATENMYEGMIQAGTPTTVIKKVILPGADHSSGVVPALIQGFLFINDIRNSNN
ncbi:MAG: alpha/beta hydrolase family protein [Chloroflexota bacterium]